MVFCGSYFALLFILILLSWSLQKFVHAENRREFKGIFGGLVLLFFAAFRSPEVCIDTRTYVSAFKFVAEQSWSDVLGHNLLKSFEPGYVIFTKILTCISTSEHFFVFITSAISIIPVIIFITKYSFSPLISYVIYIFSTQFLFSLGVIRQSMALGIVLIAYMILFEKRRFWILKSFLLIILATTFHSAALVALPLVAIAWISEMDVKFYLLVLAMIGILFLGQRTILKYIGRTAYAYADTSAAGRLIIVICFWFFFIAYKKILYEHDENAIWWEKMIIFVFMLKMVSIFFVAASRAALLYEISYVIMIPNTLALAEKRNKIFWFCGIIGAFIVLFILQVNGNQLYEYRFWS